MPVIDRSFFSECAARWQNYLNPKVKRHKWSEDEDQRLLQAFSVYGSNWKMIKKLELSDRSLQDIRNRYVFAMSAKDLLNNIANEVL